MAFKAIGMNPFADYGNIVTGNRFIGRQQEKSQIRSRILGQINGNISVVGLPRIGKSSLVWNSLSVKKDALLQRNKIIIEINVGIIDRSSDLFETMASTAYEALLEAGHDSRLDILKKALDGFDEINSDYECRNTLYKFLRRFKKSGYQIIYIFDEFDKGGDFLSLSDFQALREIGTRPEYSVRYVTISRRTIQDLEAKNGALSRFYAIFDYLHLSMFSEDEVIEYWKWLEEVINEQIPKEYVDYIFSLVGAYPFLMDVVNYQVFNNRASIKKAAGLYTVLRERFGENDLNLLYHFDEIIDLMKDEKLESQLFQSIVGPVFDLDIKSIEKLRKYGIIKAVSQLDAVISDFTGFSKYFTEYLNLKKTEFPIWDLWSSTETTLRELMKAYLNNKYGENWESSFIKKKSQKRKTNRNS